MKKLILILSLLTMPVLACQGGEVGANCMPKGVGEDSARVRKQVAQFEKEVEQGRFAEKTNGALNAIVRYAVWKLRREGYKKEATALLQEWENDWNGYLLRRDLGDHAPLSVWLAEKYLMLEMTLGEAVCHALRLDDIKIINFAIPVVFRCIDQVDVEEFGKHFIPLSGTVVYWTSFFACVGGTWGTGFLFCSPISMGCEWITESWAAPKLNPRVWNMSCN